MLSPKGFTLVEILVVLAIITVVAAVVMPVAVGATERGRYSTCVSNLRQLHAAFAMYAADHDGYLPPYQNRLGIGYGSGDVLVPVPEHGDLLLAVMLPYTKSRDIWFCPSDPLARKDSDEQLLRHQFSSYATNLLLGFPAVTGETTTMDGPSPRAYKGSASIYLLTELLNQYGPNAVRPLYTHNGMFNTMYFDGHVKSMPWEASGAFFF